MKDIEADLDSLEKIHNTKNTDWEKLRADHMFKEKSGGVAAGSFAASIQSVIYGGASVGHFAAAAAQERFHPNNPF